MHAIYIDWANVCEFVNMNNVPLAFLCTSVLCAPVRLCFCMTVCVDITYTRLCKQMSLWAAGFMSYAFVYFHVCQYDANWAKSKATASDGSPLLSRLWEGSKVCRTQTHTGISKSNPCVCARLSACVCVCVRCGVSRSSEDDLTWASLRQSKWDLRYDVRIPLWRIASITRSWPPPVPHPQTLHHKNDLLQPWITSLG